MLINLSYLSWKVYFVSFGIVLCFKRVGYIKKCPSFFVVKELLWFRAFARLSPHLVVQSMPGSKKHCSVPGCGEKNGTMFLFPKDNTQRESWRSVCRIERSISDFMLVCHHHFTSYDIDSSHCESFYSVMLGFNVLIKFHASCGRV